ncbi:MAG: hypothetical protein EKK62_09640 [Acidimicrobiia bacterium]|nr:MAG: hypothetical protein EKK62_09640 [Acidimicrobiia bacterium]
MIQRYETKLDWGGNGISLVRDSNGTIVLHSDHAAEVARLSARSDAVARLVEACRAIKEYETAGGPGYDDWDRYYDAMHEALAAVEKEIQP